MISRKKETKAQVAAKSNEAQDSFVIPLLDDGHLGAKLDLSPTLLSFLTLCLDDSGRKPTRPEDTDTSPEANITATTVNLTMALKIVWRMAMQ